MIQVVLHERSITQLANSIRRRDEKVQVSSSADEAVSGEELHLEGKVKFQQTLNSETLETKSTSDTEPTVTAKENPETPTDVEENQQEVTVKTVVTLEAGDAESEKEEAKQDDEAVAENSAESSEQVTEPVNQAAEIVEESVVVTAESNEQETTQAEVDEPTEEPPAKVEESDDVEVTVSEQPTLVQSTVVEEPETDNVPEAETPGPDKEIDNSDLTNVTQETVEPTVEGNFLQFCSHFKQTASDETVNEPPSAEPVELVVSQGKLSKNLPRLTFAQKRIRGPAWLMI